MQGLSFQKGAICGVRDRYRQRRFTDAAAIAVKYGLKS